MVSKVCGTSYFTPKTDKLVPAAAGAIADEEGCRKMAETEDTKGNMFLLKDGKCVQSFSKGEFDATVEI